MGRFGPAAVVVAVLAALATATVLAAVAGGFTPFDPDPATPTHEVTLHNGAGTVHGVSVEVLNSDGQPVVSERRRLSPGERWTVTTQTDPGKYTIRVVVDSGEGAETTYDLPLVDGDRRSFTTAYVESGGEVRIETYWQD